MNEEFQQMEVQKEEEKSSLDVVKMYKDVLKHKWLYVIILPCAFALAVAYTMGQPDFYTCTVTLAPEMKSNTSSLGGIGGIASSFGLNVGGSQAGGDAIYPSLYPDLMNSVDFKTSLFPVKVTLEGDKEKGEPSRTMSYYNYLANEQKGPWWSNLFGGSAPQKAMEEPKVDPFRLTPKQAAIAAAINSKVICDVDKKTMVISINVVDQNPLVAAQMADSVKERLQKFIIDYRTSKVRVDLAYNEKLYAETKARYDKARRLYAEFADANQDVILETVRQRQNELENEMQLQYNAYLQVAAQLLTAKAKVQEETPAFTTLQSATVPLHKSGPQRASKCLIFTILAFLLTTAWILYKEKDLQPLLGLS
jgi:capsule polysaccharide export protein KpsE/RkpR